MNNGTHNDNRPRVAFALSGASSRSIFYIGFLEVLQEQNFPVDYIAAMSGASVVAASYACGTMPELKKMALGLNTEFIFSLIERSKGKGGLYNLSKVEEYLRVYTKNLKFEEVHPQLAFVATDIVGGEEVALQVGDLAKAICASCALPGIFQPVPWGSRSLVDGGILNIVPGNVAQTANADLVIGIDMRGVRHVFSPWQIMGKRIINAVKSLLWPRPVERLWQRVYNTLEEFDFFNAYSHLQSDFENTIEQPGIFSVLGRSLDLAIEGQKKHEQEVNFNCDYLIVPKAARIPFWKKYLFLHFTDFSRTEEYYQAGRRTALEQMPTLWQKLADVQTEKELKNQTVSQLFKS